MLPSFHLFLLTYKLNTFDHLWHWMAYIVLMCHYSFTHSLPELTHVWSKLKIDITSLEQWWVNQLLVAVVVNSLWCIHLISCLIGVVVNVTVALVGQGGAGSVLWHGTAWEGASPQALSDVECARQLRNALETTTQTSRPSTSAAPRWSLRWWWYDISSGNLSSSFLTYVGF